MAVQHRDEALRERSGPTVPQSALAALTGVLNATMEETLPQKRPARVPFRGTQSAFYMYAPF
jgi:hypothetical protein